MKKVESILCVEDEEEALNSLGRILGRLCDNLYQANNGQKGLELFKQYNPNIVITDIKMPIMDGIEMSKKIKKINNKTAIILTTAFNDTKYFQEAIKIQVDGYILKPINVELLEKLITKANKTYMLEKQLKHKREIEINQKHELESIFNYSQDGIAIIDLETNFLKFNDAYLKLISLSEEELKQTSCRELTSKKDLQRLDSAIEEVKQNGFAKPFEKECFLNNKKVSVNVSMSLLPDKNKILLITKDMTEIKLLESQSRLAAMGEMIGAIAHQWRQPLNELAGQIQNTRFDFYDGNINEKYIENFIKQNMKTIKFMSNTIDDFRNFFKIEKEKIMFDVRETIIETLEIMKTQLKHHNISLSIVGDSFLIKGFKREFQQVIINLISNAKDVFELRKIKIPKINITLEKNKILIRDNAKGIKEEIIDKIFDPYYTTKKKSNGTGLGLYLSKKIIEDNMDGIIYASNIEDGMCFYIEFKQ